MEQEPWEARAAAKRAAILDKIDPQWRLSSAEVKNASKQRDLTGPFVQQFLTAEEVAMLSMESVHIVDAIKQRKLTSVKVTTTFCKAAAIAHQIVSVTSIFSSIIDKSHCILMTTVGQLYP